MKIRRTHCVLACLLSFQLTGCIWSDPSMRHGTVDWNAVLAATSTRIEIPNAEVVEWFSGRMMNAQPASAPVIPGYNPPTWKPTPIRAKFLAQNGIYIQGNLYLGMLRIEGGGEWVHEPESGIGQPQTTPVQIQANLGLSGTDVLKNNSGQFFHDQGRFFRIGNAKWDNPTDPFAQPSNKFFGRHELRSIVEEWLDEVSAKFAPAYPGRDLKGVFVLTSWEEGWFICHDR